MKTPGFITSTHRVVARPLVAARPSASILVDEAFSLQSSKHFDVDAFIRDSLTGVRAFAPTEHQALGNASVGEQVTELELGDGTTLSFGDVVALAGDFVGSADDLRLLAKTDAGRGELRWARWMAFGGQGAEPKVPDATKQRVRERNFALIGDNTSHFSHGGTAIATYASRHAEALRKAHAAGVTGNDALFASAVTDEACCQHFLSDCFAAGHVRTPILDIRAYYTSEMPDSHAQIFDYAARQVARALRDRGDVPWYWPKRTFEKKVLETIERTAGRGADSFSLGDIVALACHDADGNGLEVISDVDASGTVTPGGFHWHAVGDGKLVQGSTNWNMAVAAMRASRAELNQAWALGAAGREALPAATAVQFIPRDDSASNPALAWRWGAMDARMVKAVDACLRNHLVAELRRNAPVPAIQRYNRLGKPDANGAIELHVAEAFEAFCREVEVDGIEVIVRAIEQSATA